MARLLYVVPIFKVLSITYKGTAIVAKYTVKYLDVVLEQCLPGANMTTSIIQEADVRLDFYIENGIIFNLTTKKLLVTPLIQCHCDYACIFGNLVYPRFCKK